MIIQGLRACRVVSRRGEVVGPLVEPRFLAHARQSFNLSMTVCSQWPRTSITMQARATPSSPTPAAAAEDEVSTSTPIAIYSRPELYDIAFSYRDFKSEVRFLQDVYKQHSKGAPLSSALELGCGTGRHLAGLARAGVPKLVGLDLSPEMLTHTRASLVKLGAKAQAVELVQGDMSAFDLPHKSFDLVVCLLGTFSHLLETQQAIDCFRTAATHLRPGGLLLLELAHPGDLFDGTLIIGESGKEVWERQQANGDKVLVEWGAEFDNFDPVTQIIYRTVTINVFRGDDIVDTVEEVVPQRQYTVRELELLAAMTGFQTVGLYGEMKLGVDLEHEDAYRMVAVYRKGST